MKNVRLIFVLLLIVNCTPDTSEVNEISELPRQETQAVNCIDDLPTVRLTNNGTASFDFTVYGQNYSELHSQNVSSNANSGWVELSQNEVIIAVENNMVYGQKIQLSLVPCDDIELEIDENNVLIISGD